MSHKCTITTLALVLLFALLATGVATLAGELQNDLFLPLIRRAPAPPSGPWWAASYSLMGTLEAVATAADGGYLALGRYADDTNVLRVDPLGQVLWVRRFAQAAGRSILSLPDGGWLVAGNTGQWQYPELQDAWLAKLADDGALVWQKQYGGPANDVLAEIRPAGGGYIGVGSTASFSAGYGDGWVLRLDGDGEIIWQKAYGTADREGFRGVQPTGDDSYIAAGYSYLGDAADPWLVKLAGDGAVQWQQRLSVADSTGVSNIIELAGGYLISGTQSDNYVWAAKLGAGGDMLWQKRYDRVGGLFSGFTTAGGEGFLITGFTAFGGTDTVGWLAQMDQEGNIIWQNEYDYDPERFDSTFGIRPTADGGYILSGSAAGIADGWLLKVSATGDISSCGFIGPGSLVASEAGFAAVATTASVNDSSADALPASILAESITTQVAQQCPAPR